MLQSRRQEIIAHQDGSLIIQKGIHRGLSPTHATLVYHIIMHQTGSMQHLQTHGSMQHGIIDFTVLFCSQQSQNRTHQLPLTAQHMPQSYHKKRILVLQSNTEKRLEIFHFTLHRFPDLS